MSYNQSLAQELPEQIIKKAWESGRMSSAYLFFGPAGTGRLSLARSLAKSINCKANSFPPCSVCPSCVKIEKNNHPDVHYVKKEISSVIKIEQIHQMQREINLSCFEGRCKVFIMLNTEDLTSEAANCLLKILEEPPKDSLIILIASDLRRIFPTIISRCQKIRFTSKDRYEAEIILNRNYHLDETLSHFLAFVFEGRLLEALRFKDGNIKNFKNQIIRQFVLSSGFSFTPLDGKHLTGFNKFDFKDKEELNWLIKILITCVRDIYLLKIGQDKSELINEDIAEQLFRLAGKFTFTDLDQMLGQLCNMLENVRQNINPRLLIDNLRLLWRK